MRFIDRNSPPPALAVWKSAETEAHQRKYDKGSLKSEVKESLREHRAKDQGYLCAYTMKRIGWITQPDGTTLIDAHVEHVITQKSSLARGALDETVDYGNMVACVNRGADVPYGAPARGDTVDTLPVHPFQPSCAQRFTFHADGTVTGNTPDAEATIKKLKLDHDFLNDDRLARLSALGIGKPRTPTPSVRKAPAVQVTAAEARRRARVILECDSEGKLPEFCVALAQVYAQHALLLEKRRRQLGYARSQNN